MGDGRPDDVAEEEGFDDREDDDPPSQGWADDAWAGHPASGSSRATRVAERPRIRAALIERENPGRMFGWPRHSRGVATTPSSSRATMNASAAIGTNP